MEEFGTFDKIKREVSLLGAYLQMYQDTVKRKNAIIDKFRKTFGLEDEEKYQEFLKEHSDSDFYA